MITAGSGEVKDFSSSRISGMEGFYHDYSRNGKERTPFWQPQTTVLLLPSIQSISGERLLPFSMIEETWGKRKQIQALLETKVHVLDCSWRLIFGAHSEHAGCSWLLQMWLFSCLPWAPPGLDHPGQPHLNTQLPNATQPSRTLPEVPRVSPSPRKGRAAQGDGSSAHSKPQPRRQGSSVCCWEGKPKSHRDCASRGVS